MELCNVHFLGRIVIIQCFSGITVNYFLVVDFTVLIINSVNTTANILLVTVS